MLPYQEVKLALSIDGYGKVNDYIRYPSDWTKVEAAAKTWIVLENEHSNIIVTMNPTITIYNILYLEELVQWWYSIKGDSKYTLVFNHATWPAYVDKFLLPEKQLNKLIPIYEKYLTSDGDLKLNMKRLIVNLKNPSYTDSSLQEFYDYTKELDKLRKQNFEETLPELFEMVKPYINLIT